MFRVLLSRFYYTAAREWLSMSTIDSVVVEAVRTPQGKRDGVFSDVTSEQPSVTHLADRRHVSMGILVSTRTLQSVGVRRERGDAERTLT